MATRVVMPSLGMYTAEGSVASWLAEPGSLVTEGQPIVELSTDKTSFELDSPAAGRFHPVIELGAMVQVEGLIALVLEPGESAEAVLAAAPGGPSAAAQPSPAAGGAGGATSAGPGRSPGAHERFSASPLARHLAEELAIDLATIAGSGPNGRIVEADVRAAWAAQNRSKPAASDRED